MPAAHTWAWAPLPVAIRPPRAPGRTVFNLEEALAAADEIGLPVLMRPSYVLGGQNMIVAYTKADVIEYMGVITEHVDMVFLRERNREAVSTGRRSGLPNGGTGRCCPYASMIAVADSSSPDKVNKTGPGLQSRPRSLSSAPFIRIRRSLAY